MSLLADIRLAAARYTTATASISALERALEADEQDPSSLIRMLRAAAARDLVGWCLYNAELRGRLGGLTMPQADAALTRGGLFLYQANPLPYEPEGNREPGWNEVEIVRHNEECLIRAADTIMTLLAKPLDDEVVLDAVGWVVGRLIVGREAGGVQGLESMY